MNKLKIYCTTSDNYHHALKVFCYTFNKFWGNDWEVVVLGYKTPEFDLPTNFSFVSMGVQTGPDDWSNDLKKYFESIDDEYFIYIMEDQFIIRPINFNILRALMEVVKDDGVDRVDLTNDMIVNHSGIYKGVIPYKRVNDINIYKLDPKSDYIVNTQASIWPTKQFIKYLHPNFSPWEFEVTNSENVRNTDVLVLGTIENEGVCVHKIEGVRVNNIHHLNLNGLDHETIKELIEKKIV